MLKTHSQAEWIERAREVLPGGGFGNFDPSVFIERGQGSRVWDADGREYVDLLIGSGPMLLGHGHPEVMEAVFEQLPHGMTFFTNNTLGVELAEEICRAFACAEQVRYVTSGSEADMYAIRAARAYTGRDLILKFEGGYHGMSPEAQMSLAPTRLVNYPQAVPDSAGIPEAVRDNMLIAPFNDIEVLQSLLTEYAGQVAGIIIEPLQRLIPPAPGFLQAVRDAATKADAVLIFDEVVTGFRLAYGGAQEAYGVIPDLCTMGKIIGGGFPLAAVAGKREIMDHFDKARVGEDRWLMQLGTLSGNPVACAAGLKTMEVLRRDGQYDRLRANGAAIKASMHRHLADHAHRLVGEPVMFDTVFIDAEVANYRAWLASDHDKNARFNTSLREAGIFKSPGKIYTSLALDDQDLAWIDSAIQQAAEVLEG